MGRFSGHRRGADRRSGDQRSELRRVAAGVEPVGDAACCGRSGFGETRSSGRLGARRKDGQPAGGGLAAFLARAGDTADATFAAFSPCDRVLGFMTDGEPGVAVTDPSRSAFPPIVDGWHAEPLPGRRADAAHAREVLVPAAARRTRPRADAYTPLLRAGFSGGDRRGSLDGNPVAAEDRLSLGRFGAFGLPGLVANFDGAGSGDPSTPGYPETDPAARQRRWFGHRVATTWFKRGRLGPDIS